MEIEESELCFPQMLNFSCGRTKLPQAEAIFIYTLLSFLSLLTTTLNLLVIISISHFKQLHTPTNLLLLSLAVSDFCVGFLMSFQIILINGCWFLGDLVCVLYSSFDYIITSASVGTMVLISIDRYMAICDPLHYSSKITLKKVSVCICLCWACSILYNGFVLKENFKHPGKYNSCFGECVVVIDYNMGIADTVVTFVGPITVIIVLYMRVFVVAVSQARAMRSHITAVTGQCSENVLVKRSEMKAAKTLGIVVVAFITCLCPYYCSSLADQNSLFSVMSVALEVWLFYVNSCLNPLIYAFCYPWFQKCVKLVFTFKILVPHSCDANIL